MLKLDTDKSSGWFGHAPGVSPCCLKWALPIQKHPPLKVIPNSKHLHLRFRHKSKGAAPPAKIHHKDKFKHGIVISKNFEESCFGRFSSLIGNIMISNRFEGTLFLKKPITQHLPVLFFCLQCRALRVIVASTLLHTILKGQLKKLPW